MTPFRMRAQRGAALVVAMIFLTLLMVTVAIAFRMSNTSLKAVGNMAGEAEAQDAAEKAIERLISSDTIFTTPAATTVGTDEHGVTVSVPAPECIRSTPINVSTSGDANPNILIEGQPLTSSGFVETHWNLRAIATSGPTGATAEISQGVRLVMPDDPNPCP
jgi:Tfp pilus assembly protein PilX